MFHLQHQVNIGYWKPIENGDQLSKDNAELLGSSVIQIPPFIDYFTSGIEYHNIHHLDPGIPCYNIKKCYEGLCALNLLPDNKIKYKQQYDSLFHTIFNEKQNCMNNLQDSAPHTPLFFVIYLRAGFPKSCFGEAFS